MGFEYLGVVENRINKKRNYYGLLEKYFNGKTLEERTLIENDDILKNCDGSINNELMGVQYCPSMSRKFDCKYQCEINSNGLRPCSKNYQDGVHFYDKIITGFMDLNEDDISVSLMLSNKRNNFNQEDLATLEEKCIKVNNETTFKQRVYNKKLS